MNNWAAHRHRSILCPIHCAAQTRWLTLQNRLQWHLLIEMCKGWEVRGNKHCSSHHAWLYVWDGMQANIILTTKLYTATNPLDEVHCWYSLTQEGGGAGENKDPSSLLSIHQHNPGKNQLVPSKEIMVAWSLLTDLTARCWPQPFLFPS